MFNQTDAVFEVLAIGLGMLTCVVYLPTYLIYVALSWFQLSANPFSP